MAFRSSSRLAYVVSGTGAVAVPAGAAAGDIAVVGYYIESAATITAPSGFTQKSDVATNPTTQGRLVVFWKRLTGADSGTYSFTHTSAGHEVTCALFSGRVASGDPFTAVNTADAGAAGRTVTVTAITAAANDDLVGIGGSFAGSGSTWTATSMTVRQGSTGYDCMIATQDNVSAGTTANKAYAYTGGSAGGMKGFLGALAVASSTTPVGSTRTVSFNTGAAIGSTRSIGWDAKAQTGSTRTLAWVARATVGSTRTASWIVKQTVGATRTLSWRVAQAVGATRQFIWDVAGTLISVGDTRGLSWSTKAQIGSTRTLSWSTKTQIGSTRTLSWVVKKFISATRTLSWSTKSRVTTTRTLSWLVKSIVGSNRSISYDVIVTAGPGGPSFFVVSTDGDLMPATLKGVWNGTAVVPATVTGVS